LPFGSELLKKSHTVKFFQDGKHTYWADRRFYGDNLAGMKAFLDEHLRGAGTGERGQAGAADF
jgi:hypothetical protein